MLCLISRGVSDRLTVVSAISAAVAAAATISAAALISGKTDSASDVAVAFMTRLTSSTENGAATGHAILGAIDQKAAPISAGLCPAFMTACIAGVAAA